MFIVSNKKFKKFEVFLEQDTEVVVVLPTFVIYWTVFRVGFNFTWLLWRVVIEIRRNYDLEKLEKKWKSVGSVETKKD